MIFEDFRKFNDPIDTGFFPARKRTFLMCFEKFKEYLQHFPGNLSKIMICDDLQHFHHFGDS